MQQKHHARLFIFLIMISFLCVSFTCQAGGGIKERMKARVPVIAKLKTQGIIGENNKGYLEFRKNDRGKAALIDAENKDRNTVYSAISRQQRVSVDLVSSRRAAKIAQMAKPGTWLQDSSGSWYQK